MGKIDFSSLVGDGIETQELNLPTLERHMPKTIISVILLLLLAAPHTAQDNATESDALLVNPQYFYTHHQATGNRIIAGQGTFPNVVEQDIEFRVGNNQLEQPLWLVGASGEIVRWYAVSANNTPAVLTVVDGNLQFDVLTTLAFAEKPPVLAPQGAPVPAAGNDESLFSNPVPYGEGWLYIAQNGDLVYVSDGEERSRIALNIQSDARLVVNEKGQIAVYANGTNQRYVHGIMGDDIEGSSLVVLEVVDDKLDIVTQIDLEGDAVYEGLSPIWADVDEDTMPDLITTVSDSRVGSRIRVYRMTYDGIREADGPAIGQAHRWQHQLAFAPFGPNGEMELVDVLTPHIGGVVRFYRFNSGSMEIVAQQGGYTSHVIGARNLDMAVAGDFNGDGTPEIALPSQNRRRIAGIQHTATGTEVMWEFSLGNQLATNLAAVQTPDGKLALAAGTVDGRLRVWLSQ